MKFPWGLDPEDADLLKFIIEKTKDMKSPVPKRQLAEEFTTERGCPEKFEYFVGRISYFQAGLNRNQAIDNDTKIKLLFLLSVSCNKKLLQIVQMVAHVEVDGKNRITKYRANDGSINLGGDHRQMKKKKDGTPPESTKRPAVEVSDNSTKRPRIDHKEPEANHPSSGVSGSFWHSNQEPMEYAPLENYPLSGSMEIPSHAVVPQEPEIEEMKPKFTPKLKFLEAIKSLVISLDTPTLSRIQSAIQQKIWKIDQSNNGIPNDEMIPVMDLLVARIANHFVSDLPETVESISFKEFLCYLKAVILSLKLEGLEVLLEKIKERNKEAAMKDKKIPVEKVASILQYSLDFI